MNARELFTVMLRRWYVPLAVLLVVAAVALHFERGGGIYSTRTVISFTYPDSSQLAPYNGQEDTSVIAFAGSVAQLINDGKAPLVYSSDDAPYYGAGVRQGVLVSLPNSGSQWTQSYSQAEIEIQIVGRTEGWVRAQQTSLITKVLAYSDFQQGVVSTSDAKRITAEVVPTTQSIAYIGPSAKSRLMAMAAMGVAAFLLGGWGAVLVDRLRPRRRRRRASAPAPATPPARIEGALA